VTDRGTGPTNPPARANVGMLQHEEHSELHLEEVERTRTFGVVIAFLCFFVLAFVPLLGTDLWLLIAMALALTTLGTASVLVVLLTRWPRHYTAWVFRSYGATAVIASVLITYCLGTFSPTPLAVVLGIAYFAQGHDRLGSICIPLGAILGYLFLALLLTLNLLTDRGVIGGAEAPPAGRVFFTIVVPIVYTVTMVQGWANQRATVDLRRRALAASRAAAIEAARFDEVRQQLEVAVKAGAQARGVWTGHTAGPWVLGGIIGRGATSEVYAAAHEGQERNAAVKVLREGLISESELQRRFAIEGRALAALVHPGIVRIHDVGLVEDRAPYIAMEHLVGQDLTAHLRQHGALGRRESVELVRQVALALDHAHTHGIIHRDIKPQNLFRVSGSMPRWKILDFGIAKLTNQDATQTGQGLMGTPGYTAPEQLEGAKVDARADVFSLGAVAYRTLLGRPAFSGDSSLAIIHKVSFGRPLRPLAVDPSLPDQVDGVLAIALSREPGLRFASASELATALAEAMKGTLSETRQRYAQSILSREPWASMPAHPPKR